jgi:ribosomal protein L37AE/L43A
MAAKKKKIKAAGKFRSGYGVRARKNFNKIEASQRRVQKSPISENSTAKRIAVGIWIDKKSGKKFAGPAYSLEE